VLQELGLPENSANGNGPKEKGEKHTQAELLIRCADEAELFNTPAGDAYATIQVGGHRETHPIKSKGFRRWCVRGYFDKYGRPPGAQALQDALGVLEARAQFNGPEYEVHVRVADHRETHAIKSKGFRRWFVRAFFEKYGRPPGAQALQDALGLLEARAQFDGPEQEVHVRVADHEGVIYIDLANDRWEAVQIRAGGWRAVSIEDTSVRFRRPR
jgi:hypothetical protein